MVLSHTMNPTKRDRTILGLEARLAIARELTLIWEELGRSTPKAGRALGIGQSTVHRGKDGSVGPQVAEAVLEYRRNQGQRGLTLDDLIEKHGTRGASLDEMAFAGIPHRNLRALLAALYPHGFLPEAVFDHMRAVAGDVERDLTASEWLRVITSVDEALRLGVPPPPVRSR
jgi:hypothetical protein